MGPAMLRTFFRWNATRRPVGILRCPRTNGLASASWEDLTRHWTRARRVMERRCVRWLFASTSRHVASLRPGGGPVDDGVLYEGVHVRSGGQR